MTDDFFGLQLGGIVLAVVGLYFFGTPWLIYHGQRFKACPAVMRFDLDETPPPGVAGEYFRSMDNQLQALGFERRDCLTLPDAVPNVKALVVMYVNRRTEDLAMSTMIYAMNPVSHAVSMKTSYVEILARYKDDELEVLHTNNVQMLGSFPTSRGSRAYRFPHVEDLARLFELHQKLLDRDRPSGRKYIRLDAEFGGDCVTYLQTAAFRESYDKQIETGYLKYHAEDHTYRPTIMGAHLMTWRELWPIKQVLWEGTKAQAKRLERELS